MFFERFLNDQPIKAISSTSMFESSMCIAKRRKVDVKDRAPNLIHYKLKGLFDEVSDEWRSFFVEQDLLKKTEENLLKGNWIEAVFGGGLS